MNNKIFKGLFSVALMACAMSVSAQLPVLSVQKAQLPAKSKAALKAGKPAVAGHLEVAGKAAPRTVDLNDVVTRGGEKPGTFYTVETGYYNLVPGLGLATVSEDSVVFARNGIMAYPDRDLHFIHATKEGTYSAFEWDFGGDDKFTEDTIRMHPFFAPNGVYLETPKLTATKDGVDSVYCMGGGYEDGKFVPGMVALSGMGYVYNVDVDGYPFANTFYNSLSPNDPWGAGHMLFGWDTTDKPAYMEIFDAPKKGGIMLWGTHFYVMTPTSVDLGKKRFAVSWSEHVPETDEWKMVKEFTEIRPRLVRDLSNDAFRVWDVTVNTDMPEVLVKNSFYVMIVGPQDGTKWALMAQLDRIDYPDPERNTAYFVPTVGEYAGQVRQYVLQDQTGKAFNYASSLDIHQFVATPYMIMSKKGTDVIEDTNYDFNATGEVRNLLISDWLGGSSNGVSITAAVSNSSHGDWFSVTQPVAAEGKSNLFAITLTAQAKPFNVKGRRATLTLTDNKGFSRDLTIYQGDRSAADDALSVEAVNASGRVDVTAAGEGFDVIYPSSYNCLDVYATSGQLVGTYALSAGGSAHIAAASWQKGIYMFQFAGSEGTQVVKVLKK